MAEELHDNLEEKYPENPLEEEEDPMERQQVYGSCLDLYIAVEGRILAHQAEPKRAAAAAAVNPVPVVGPTKSRLGERRL